MKRAKSFYGVEERRNIVVADDDKAEGPHSMGEDDLDLDSDTTPVPSRHLDPGALSPSGTSTSSAPRTHSPSFDPLASPFSLPGRFRSQTFHERRAVSPSSEEVAAVNSPMRNMAVNIPSQHPPKSLSPATSRSTTLIAAKKKCDDVIAEYLHPVNLRKEVERLLDHEVVADTQLLREHKTVLWNLLLHIHELRIPSDILLPQVDWSALAEEYTAIPTPVGDKTKCEVTPPKHDANHTEGTPTNGPNSL